MKLLSIIICTYNRSDKLKRVLDDLQRQVHRLVEFSTYPNISGLEILVVGNNSTDDTKAVVDNYLNSGNSFATVLRYEFASEQGSSAARNYGIRHSTGSLIAFLDDDIYLDDQYLSALSKLAETYPQLSIFGGRVIPDWAKPIPNWLRLQPPFEIIQSAFPSHEYGDEQKIYPFKFGKRSIYNPISANLMVTRDVFNKIGDFRLDLGIRADTRGACEDTEFCWRALANGVKVLDFPQVSIFHPIPEERMTKEFVLTWYELLGKTLAWMQKNNLNHLQKNARASFTKTFLKLLVYRILQILTIIDFMKESFWIKCQIRKAEGELEILHK